jgi:hypothetical protein
MPSRQTQTTNAQHPWGPAQSWVTFTLLTLLLLWTIHAVVFFAHEYAHSFTAWLLGWKANPLDLHYGHLTTGNLLVQVQIDENVEYDPIFAAGHSWQAGLIAAAGMVLGNGLISYSISRWGYSAARRHGSRTWAMAFYWMCVASIGNFIDYVPVRTFSFHGDMHTLEKGFSCSPWWIMLVLGIPTAIALLDFLVKFEPQALQWLFPESAARRGILVFLTAFILFGFYGSPGWSNSGQASHIISVVSVCAFVPVMTIFGWWIARQTTPNKSTPGTVVLASQSHKTS